MTGPRILKPEERRLLADALVVAAKQTRQVKSDAVADRFRAFSIGQKAHIDALDQRIGDLERLAAEVREHDVRLERPVVTRDEVIAALMQLPTEDMIAVGNSLLKGFLLAALDERQLAPKIASMLDLEGILIVVADARGPVLESTSRDDARPLCKLLFKGLHKTVSEEIDTTLGANNRRAKP